MFRLQVDDLCIRLWDGIVNGLAVDFLRRTSLSDKDLREIFPAERKLVLWYLQSFVISVPTTMTANAYTIANHIDGQPSSTPFVDDACPTIVVVKAVILALHAHTPVLV